MLQLRADLDEHDLDAGYYVLVECIGYYAQIARAGEDEADGALCSAGERVTIPASTVEEFANIGVRVAVGQQVVKEEQSRWRSL